MPFDPKDPRLVLAEQLALGLASIYLKPGQLADLERGRIALGALTASLELFRQATGRPEGWKPTAGDWLAIATEANAEADAEQVKLDKIPQAHAAAKPVSSGGGLP